jgi:hypothetical protein
VHSVDAIPTVNELECLVVCVKHKLELNQVMLPLLQSMKDCIKLQLIGGSLPACITEFLAVECH